MIIFLYGTTAEAIKLAPIMRRLSARGVEYQQWLTYQHTDVLTEVATDLELGPPDVTIAMGNQGRALERPTDFIGWFRQIGRWLRVNRVRLRNELPDASVIIVHGDTMTSVVGAIIARTLKRDCAHVEAGLRSGNLRHPFPEELDRRIVGKLAKIHYAPSRESVDNLKGRPNVIFTHGNTVNDAVRDELGTAESATTPYGLVLLHRYEFISNPGLVEQTLRVLAEGTDIELRFVVDVYARDVIASVVSRIQEPRFILVSKQKHSDFIKTVINAEFVVTDSGGVQEEAAFLGVPTLVHRKVSERSEGFGANVVLSDWDYVKVAGFLSSYRSLVRDIDEGMSSPSEIVVEDLIRRGYTD